MNVDELARLTAEQDEASFCHNHPTPVFVLLVPVVRRKSYPPQEDVAPVHLFPSYDGETELVMRREVADVSELIFVPRSTTGLFTIGRAPERHIRLPAPSISKIHAYLEVGPTLEVSLEHDLERVSTRTLTGWRVTDARSTNGTFVGGKPLDAGESVELEDGVELRFGPDVHVKFFTPRELYGLLELYRLGVIA